MSNYKIFKINGQGKGTLTSVPPEDIVEIGSNLSGGGSDGGVITEDSDTVAFTGNGTVGNPLSAESVGGETLTAEQIKALYESNGNTNAFTDNEKTKLAGLENYNDSPIISALGNKVDKVSGKSLSTNDYSDSEKTKLAEIETGANNYVLPATSGTVLGGVKEVYLTQSAYNALTPKLTDVKYHIEKI